MELAGQDVSPLHGCDVAPAMRRPRHRPVRRLRRPIAVGEIGVAGFQKTRRVCRAHLVPAELWHPDLVGKAPYMTVHHAEALHARVLIAGLEQELMPDADGDG